MVNGRLKLTPTDDDYDVDPREPESPRWRSAVITLIIVNTFISFASLLYVQYDRSAMRRDLDENAALVKQLQETLVIKMLSKIRKE